MTTRTPASSSRLTLTVGLCFLVALMEGLDLQAAGIAAVGIAHAFALDKTSCRFKNKRSYRVLFCSGKR